MPSRYQSGGRDFPPFPGIEEHIGHNPARFLDWSLATNDAARGLLKARIRGIDRVAAIRAYKAVERNPRVGPQEDPRDRVIELLNEREAELEARGERPDRIPFGPRRPCDCCDHGRDDTAADAARERRRERREETTGSYSPTSPAAAGSERETSASTLGEFGATVTTDGGEDDTEEVGSA